METLYICYNAETAMIEGFSVASGIGALVRKLRKERHWSMKKLSEISGVDDGQISRIENGQTTNIQRNTLTALAHAFQLEELAFLAMAAPPEQMLAAELIIAGRPDAEAEALLRIWPRLPDSAKEKLLESAMQYVREVEADGVAPPAEDTSE